jgi:hypothetical protein
VLVWFSVGALLALALYGGADLPYALVEGVGGKVVGSISLDGDEGLRDVDEAVDFKTDCGEELFPVRR